MYFNAFPKLKKYHEDAKQETMNQGYILVDKVIKRKVFIPKWKEFLQLKNVSFDNKTKEQVRTFYSLKGEIERKSVNYKIQGTGANQTKYSLIQLRKYILKNNIDAYLVSTVHDEIVVECNNQIAESLANKIIEIMRECGNKFVTKVDMSASYEIADTWVK